MPTNYPDGTTPGYPPGRDVFNEPSIPEETTLSSGGTASRNHTEHHRDLGDAVEAIEANTALKGHDHSGTDPLNPTSKLAQANTHESPDTNASPAAIHHTLGTGANQAATGNHHHDYNGPTIENQPLLLCTSGARPLNPAVGTMIYETDTNRVRAWSTFMDNVVVTGLNSTDNFNRTLPNDLGVALWELSYDTPTGAGKWAIPDGVHASWIDAGNTTNRVIGRRINASDAQTLTDDQVITWQTGDVTVEETLIFTAPASNDIYFRMSADKQSYIRLEVGNDWIRLSYTVSGKANEQPLGSITYLDTDSPNTQWRAQMKGREFTIYRLGELLTTIKDTKALSAMGAANRGWGAGAVAGARVFGQTTPANIDWIKIQDLVYFASANRWTLLNVASVPVVRLRQSKVQKLIYSGSVIEWSEEVEDNFGFFNPAVQTDIVIQEAGLYLIECGVQWDPEFVPDVATIALMVNGQDTTVRQQQFIRGNGFTPGFSQTISVQGKLRFAVGDTLQVKAKYTVGSSLLDKIFSYFDPASKINSRIDLHFMSP